MTVYDGPTKRVTGPRGKKSMKPPPLTSTFPVSPLCTESSQRRRVNIRFLAAPCITRLVPKIRAPSRLFATLDPADEGDSLTPGWPSRVTRQLGIIRW